MLTRHWRGQGEGHPAVLGVPAPGASLGRAQTGRGSQLLPKNLLVLAGWVNASCSGLPLPLLPPSCPGEGLALLGHPRTQPGCPLLGRDGPGLPNPLLPSRKGGSGSHGGSHKAPAQLRPQTHHTRAGGEVTRGRVQHPPSGAPSRDRLRTPLQTRAGAGRERGRIPALGGCSQRLFLCRKRQNSLGSGPGPSAGNKGAGQGLGDMGTCPRAQCLIDFQHYPGRG